MKKATSLWPKLLILLVGAEGFEPPTSRSQTAGLYFVIDFQLFQFCVNY